MQIITTNTLEEMRERQETLALINVLDEAAHKRAHIPGSANIPVDDAGFLSRVESTVGDKQSPVVVYCANADCPASSRAARLLDEAGFKAVYEYEGGTESWREHGNRVEGSV